MVLASLTVALAACAGEEAGLPECELDGNAVVLMAQAVPAAQLVPCIQGLQTGWSFRSLDAEDGRARFRIDSDRVGDRFLTVSLALDCDPGSARAVTSDEPRTQLYVVEDISQDRYVATWHYRFEGGCATYEFDARGEGTAAIPLQVAQQLSFVTRGDIDLFVREEAGSGL